MMMLPLKSSRNEQLAVIRVLWQMRFTLRYVQCMATCFTRPAVHVWCTKFARGRENIVDKERPGWHVVATTDVTVAAVDAFVQMGEMFERT